MSDLSALPKCDDPSCTGHLGKFDSCLSEALYEASMDAMTSTGTTDFEGYYVLHLIEVAEEWTLGGDDSDGPRITVPAGNYISHTASSGQVSLWTYETPELARAEFDAAEARYAAWDES